MARPKRINIPHCLYHVFSRTNSGDIAFQDIKDQDRFFYYLEKYTRLFSFRVHAFCLLPNHFHLLLESTDLSSLSEIMRRLLTAYTIYYNRRYSRHGHLFQGRFKSLVVHKADYLLTLSWYIHKNPEKMPVPVNPETYPGSSLHYYINGGEPSFLYTSEILSWFKGQRNKYADFIRKGLDQDSIPVIHQQRYIGGDAFVKRMNKRITIHNQKKSAAAKKTSTQKQKKPQKENNLADLMLKKVAEYFGCDAESLRNGHYIQGNPAKARRVLIALLRERLPWSIPQIAQYLGIRQKSGKYYQLKQFSKDTEVLSYLGN